MKAGSRKSLADVGRKWYGRDHTGPKAGWSVVGEERVGAFGGRC